MKKTVAITYFLTLMTALTYAAEKEKRFGLNTGVMYPRIFNITAQYEWETLYHNAWEVYFDYATQWSKCRTCNRVCTDTFWKEHYSYGIGMAYKPCIRRGRNSTGRIRMGTDIGANTRQFALGLELGVEWVWTLRNRMQFVFQQKNEVTFWAKPRFKNGALLGIRIPLTR